MISTPLVILGAGNVGQSLVTQLLASAGRHEQRDGIRLRISAWCDRTGAAVDPRGLGPETFRALVMFKDRGTPLAETPAGYRQEDPAAIVDVAGTDGCIVVDVTASDRTVPALELAISRGYGVVTANKIPLTLDQATFDRLAGHRRFRYESTVGSAVPVIETLHGLLRANDEVTDILGVLSGTLGFIFAGLESGHPFSELVRKAVARGYAEPDPRIDLSGRDVARKALILARTLGRQVEMGEIPTESLAPEAMSGFTPDEFLDRLPELDAPFAARAAEAAARGSALRYVAEIGAGGVTVGTQAVPLDSALGRLRGSDNLVAFSTRYYKDEPLVLQGRGAGADVAAAGVHADIVALAGAISL